MTQRNRKTLRTTFAHDLFSPHVEYLHHRSFFSPFSSTSLRYTYFSRLICHKRCNRVEKKRFIDHERVLKIVPNVHIHFNADQIQAIIWRAKSASKSDELI